MFHLAQHTEKGNGSIKAPSKKQVRWQINTPAGEPVKMRITPEVAAEMLEYNDRNRPLSKGYVKRLAEQMTAGKWRQTPSPVIFSKAGRLTDGQHRLAAIIESGLSQEMWVFFGDDDENFFVFDTGAKRTAGHIFAINGIGDYNVMAAAVRLVALYDANRLGGIASVTSGQPLTNEELWNKYLEYKNINESNRIGQAFHENRLASKSLMVAVHYICARKSRQKADEFFLKAATGVGLVSKKEPAAVLHKKLIEFATGQQIVSRPTIAALAIKAWNAERDGRSTLGRLTYRTETNPDERFPRAR